MLVYDFHYVFSTYSYKHCNSYTKLHIWIGNRYTLTIKTMIHKGLGCIPRLVNEKKVTIVCYFVFS